MASTHKVFKTERNGFAVVRSLLRRFSRWPFNAYQRRLIERGWYDPSARCNDDVIFIGGCGRSGTTLFREMLNRHPRIACGPETSIFGLPFGVTNQAPAWSIDAAELEALAKQSRNLVEYAEWFFRKYLLEPQGKPRWADKTPNNVRAVSKLLTWFPRGKFIHMIRDGRDVACSLRHHPKEKIINGRPTRVQTDNPIEKCATRWLNDTSAGLAFRGHPLYLEVRYEDLVHEPEAELRRVCEFVGEEFDTVMLDPEPPRYAAMGAGRLVNNENVVQPVSSRSIGRWQRDLSPGERQVFVDIAGELLIVTGYVADHRWVTDQPSESAGLTPSITAQDV